MNPTDPPRPSRRPLSIPATPLEVSIDLSVTEVALVKYKPRALKLSASEVNPARLDVTLAATVALAGIDNVLGERERIVELFKNPKLDVIERAREVALAAQHADLLHRAAQDEEATYGDILPRMTALRGILLDDMDLIRKRQPRLVSQKALDEIRRGDQRVQDKANDLNDCVDWYRRNRKAIGRTTVTDEELAEAANLATEALARVGKNLVARTPKEGEVSTGEMRRRVFSLLVADYDTVQQYGAFLFWGLPGGWEQYVPSLWSGRATGPGAKPEEPSEEPEERAKEPA